MSDEKPPERVTTQIPKVEIVEGLLKQLTQTMVDGFHSVRVDMRSAEERAEARFARIEQRQAEHDARAARNSDRAKDIVETTSNADLSLQAKQSEALVKQMEHDRKIAETHAIATETQAAVAELRSIATESLAKQTELYTELLKVTKHPLVRKIAYGLAGLAVGWLTAKGLL